MGWLGRQARPGRRVRIALAAVLALVTSAVAAGLLLTRTSPVRHPATAGRPPACTVACPALPTQHQPPPAESRPPIRGATQAGAPASFRYATPRRVPRSSPTAELVVRHISVVGTAVITYGSVGSLLHEVRHVLCGISQGALAPVCSRAPYAE